MLFAVNGYNLFMKKIIYVLIALVVAGGAAYYLTAGNNVQKVRFKTEKVLRGAITETVTASGVINPVNTVLVGTQVSGTIIEIYADFNSIVTKGQLIARIDPAIFQARLEQARASLLIAEAGHEKAEADLLNATRELGRLKNLFAKESISKSALQKSETDFASAEAQVSMARAQIAQARAALNQDETNLQYASILSPVDGIVISRNINVGQTVAASFQTPTLFTIAEDLTKMQIDASVDEADIGRITAGQSVTFTVDAYPLITFRGEVSTVRFAATTIENVVTYDVVIKVDNPELKLKPGMTATVAIVVSERKDVLSVPAAALRYVHGPARHDTQGIWRLLKGSQPERLAVTTGITDGERVEITSAGLSEGDEVIVKSLGKQDNKSGKRRRGFL